MSDKICTICGDAFEPQTAQAAAKRELCYDSDCIKERQRRLDYSTMVRHRAAQGRDTGPRRTGCARCDGAAHIGETCRAVAA